MAGGDVGNKGGEPGGTPGNLQQSQPVPASFFDAVIAVAATSTLNANEKRELFRQLKQMNTEDTGFVSMLAICLLGAIALVSIIVIMILAMTSSKDVPQGLIAIASAAVGGLAALLSPSRKSGTSSP